jgi:hypothetical protein
MDRQDFDPELAGLERAQQDHARAQLEYFRVALVMCQLVRKQGVPGVINYADGNVRLHRDGKVEITNHLDATYTLEQIPGFIEALERYV